MTLQRRLDMTLHPRVILSPEERGRQSMKTAAQIFSDQAHFPCIRQIAPMPNWCIQDKQGTDFEFFLVPDATDTTGIEKLKIQIKSSEHGVEQFLAKGREMKVSGYDLNLIVLNCGEWPLGMIHADFVAQFANLVGIFNLPDVGHEYEMGDFLNLFHQDVAANFRTNKDRILQYRSSLFEFVQPCRNGHC